jgi:hypothetical protein
MLQQPPTNPDHIQRCINQNALSCDPGGMPPWVALTVVRGTPKVMLFALFAVPFKTQKSFAIISELNPTTEMNSVILYAILELEFVGGSIIVKGGGAATPAGCRESRSA